MKNGAKTKTLADWQAANDQYLTAAVAWVRLLLERHAQDRPQQRAANNLSSGFSASSDNSTGSYISDSDSTDQEAASTSGPAHEAIPQKPKTRRKPRKKEESESSSSESIQPAGYDEYQEYGESAPILSMPVDVHDEQIEMAARKMEEAQAHMDPPPALVLLSQRLGLSRFEKEILLLCVAVELDTRIAGLCAEVQRNPVRPYPTFSVALTIFLEAAWEALSPEQPLALLAARRDQPAGQPAAHHRCAAGG